MDKTVPVESGSAKGNDAAEDSRCHELTIDAFAGLFEAGIDDFSDRCRELIEQMDFRYREITGRERDELILEIRTLIDSCRISVAGRERKDVWEKGWSENLQNFINSGYDLTSLAPAYLNNYSIARLNCDYMRLLSPEFLLNFYKVYRCYFFEKYLTGYDTIYEFGCGTGLNLVMMSQLFPDKDIHGADWVEASKELVDKIAEVYGYNLKGHLFDMFTPDEDLDISGNCAVVTLNSLEQIGCDYEPFLQFVLRKKPAICINFEPLVELYDENNPIDRMAIEYHRKRGYLDGYVTRLRQLESEGKIKIVKTQRIYFGSQYQEGYSLVIWKPEH